MIRAALFVAAGLTGFSVGFLMVLIVMGGRRKPAPTPPAPAPQPQPRAHVQARPLLDMVADRLTEQLMAELDDPAAVDAWLRGERR